MNIRDFGNFSTSFGLVNSPCKIVAESFLSWQQYILRNWGFELTKEERKGRLCDALDALLPRTSPIATKYLFWPVDESWTLYFDNSAIGTDAGPPQVLSQKLGVTALRVVMSEESVNSTSGKVLRYPATIFEYFVNGIDRRQIYAANDGGKWKFGESGEPFPFENSAKYAMRSIKDRFTSAMLLEYLKALGVDLSSGEAASIENESAYLFTKHGKMPVGYKEYHD